MDWLSDDFAAQLGYPASDLPGSGWVSLVVPEDQRAAEQALALARGGQTATFEVRLISRGGSARRTRGLIEGTRDATGAVSRLVGACCDVTDSYEAQRRQDLILRVAEVLADSGSTDMAIGRLLEAVGSQLKATAGVFWRLNSRTRRLNAAKTWSGDGAAIGRFLEASQGVDFEIGEGLPGRAWQSRRAVVVADVAREVGYVRASAALASDLRGAYAFPIVNGTEFIGVFEMLTHAQGEADPSMAATMDELGSRIGNFLRRKEIEETLRQSEALRRAVFEACPDCIITADEQGRVIDLNEASETILGMSRGSMVGRRIGELLVAPGEDRRVENALSEALGPDASPTGVPLFETQLRRPDDTTATVEVRFQAVLGSPRHVALYLRDLTETRMLKAELRKRDEELQDFINNGTVGLHWVREDGTIEWANQTELTFLGYDQSEYVGHSIVDFHADADTIQDILKRLLANQTVVNHPARLRAKDGSVKHVLINSSVYRRDGVFVHTRCFTTPIPETIFRELLRERSGFCAIPAQPGLPHGSRSDA